MTTTLNVTNDSTGETVWVGPRDLFIQHNKDGLTVHDAIALNELEPGRVLMLGGGAAPLLKVEAEERLPLTPSSMYMFMRYLPYVSPVHVEPDGDIVVGYACGDRELRVWWDVADQDCVGWAWATRQRDDGPYWDSRESGPLESASELRRLMLWVDQARS